MCEIAASLYLTPVTIKDKNCAKIERKSEEMNIEKDRRDFPLEWVSLSRNGDHDAMESLYEYFKTSFYGLAYRYTYDSAVAEDLFQDIFIKIFTHLKDLDKDEAFTGWAYRIAVNTCLSYLRHRNMKLKKSVSLQNVEPFLADKEGGDPEKLIKNSLEEALRGISAKLKSVFILHDVQGFKHKEIARIMGCSEGTSKSQLFKARMKIRKYLEIKQVL
jgi:RNA polymerase sigma-70 factor (ECF subfamily)